MRELKFKAWHKKHRQMEYCLPVEILLGGTPQEHAKIITDGTYEIMQFTGLKDKNDVEIYEGDILEGLDDDNDSFRLTVEWRDVTPDTFTEHGWGAKTYQLDEFTEKVYEDEAGWLSDESAPGFWHTYEVIGTIYEDPELLK